MSNDYQSWTLQNSLQRIANDTTGMTAQAAAQFIANAVANAGGGSPDFPGDVTVGGDLDVDGDITTEGSISTTGSFIHVNRVGDGAAGALYISSDAGSIAELRFRTGTSTRWIARKTSGAETGSNAGSNFQLNGYDDSGTQIGAAISIQRASLDVTLGGALNLLADENSDIAAYGAYHQFGYHNFSGPEDTSVVINANANKKAAIFLSANATSSGRTWEIARLPNNTDSYDFVLNRWVSSSPTEVLRFSRATGEGFFSAPIHTNGVVRKLTASGIAAVTLTEDDHIYVGTGSGSTAVTLPAIGTTGREYIIKNTGSGTITVSGAGSDTIDGGNSQNCHQWDSITVVDNGTDWSII